jgi:hypothetical protein
MRALIAALAAALLRHPAPVKTVNKTTACEIPADFQNHTANGWSLLSVSEKFVVIAEDNDGEEANVMLFDCVRNKRLLFVHIPKNAGTTIEDIAFNTGVKWGRHYTLQPQRLPDGNVCQAWHTPPAYFPGATNPYSDAEVFCVTRDPTDRMLSEYTYLVSVKWGDNNPRLRTAPECSELGLNNFVASTLRVVQSGQPFVSDCHFTPQTMFIYGPHKQWCTNIIRIDGLPDSFNNLMSDKGYPGVQLGKQKKNTRAHKCENLSVQSFTPETKQLISQVYATDFQRLGYTPPI